MPKRSIDHHKFAKTSANFVLSHRDGPEAPISPRDKHHQKRHTRIEGRDRSLDGVLRAPEDDRKYLKVHHHHSRRHYPDHGSGGGKKTESTYDRLQYATDNKGNKGVDVARKRYISQPQSKIKFSPEKEDGEVIVDPTLVYFRKDQARNVVISRKFTQRGGARAERAHTPEEIRLLGARKRMAVDSKHTESRPEMFGWNNERWSKDTVGKDAHSIFLFYDRDQDNQLNRQETERFFVDYCKLNHFRPRPDDVKRLMAIGDRDGDGMFTRQELDQFLEEFQETMNRGRKHKNEDLLDDYVRAQEEKKRANGPRVVPASVANRDDNYFFRAQKKQEDGGPSGQMSARRAARDGGKGGRGDYGGRTPRYHDPDARYREKILTARRGSYRQPNTARY